MDSYNQRLERLVEENKISISQGFTLSRALEQVPVNRQEEILNRLEFQNENVETLLEELKINSEERRKEEKPHQDQAFQDFTQRMKDFGKEVGSELENIVNEFDKEKFKTELKGLFQDLSQAFNNATGRKNGRNVHGDYKENDLTLMDQLHIEGNGQMRNLILEGSLSVQGDLTLHSLKGSGNLKVKGRFICKSLDFRGEIQCQNDIQIGTANNQGRVLCVGDYSGADMENHGTVNCHGDVQLIRLNNHGSFSVDRSIRADNVDSKGSINCLGLLKASFISMNQGRVKMMEGDQIQLGSQSRVEDLTYRMECNISEGARVQRKRQVS